MLDFQLEGEASNLKSVLMLPHVISSHSASVFSSQGIWLAYGIHFNLEILNMWTKIFCQITTRRINFIVDNTDSNGDGLDYSSEIRDQEKDRSWLMSSLHQIYSRRWDVKKLFIMKYVCIYFLLSKLSNVPEA